MGGWGRGRVRMERGGGRRKVGWGGMGRRVQGGDGMDGLEENKIEGLREEGRQDDKGKEGMDAWRERVNQNGHWAGRIMKEDSGGGGMEGWREEREETRRISFFLSFATTIFKPTRQGKPARRGIAGFGLEIWNRGNDMIFKHGDSYTCIFHIK